MTSRFHLLLERLHGDPVRAEAEFERLRRTLLRFFDWRGASAPDDLADETLDRLARKLQEGTAVADLGAFAHGIARLVLHESVRGDARHRGLDGVEPHAPSPRESGEAELLAVRLERCLAALPRDSRELLLAYYSGGGGGEEDRDAPAPGPPVEADPERAAQPRAAGPRPRGELRPLRRATRFAGAGHP